MKYVNRIALIFLLFIFTVNVFGDSKTLSVSLQSLNSTTPGGYALVDLILNQTPQTTYLDIDGFQLMLAYDSSKIKLWDIYSSLLNDSCKWKISFMNIFSDNPPLEYLWIKVAATNVNSIPGSDCFITDKPAMTIEFLVDESNELEGDSTTIDFVWLSCDDNNFWSNQNDIFLIAKNVFDSDSLDITDDSQNLPSKSGPGYNCLSSLDSTIKRDLDFYSTKFFFQLPTEISESNENLPLNYRLEQNYPNPFNPTTKIVFYLPVKTQWNLEIVNITGQTIKNYSGETKGEVTINWNGENSQDKSVSSGIYFYTIITEDYSESKKMILLK